MRNYSDDNGQAQAEDAPASPAAEGGDRSFEAPHDARGLPPTARETTRFLRAGRKRPRKAFQPARRRVRFRGQAEGSDARQRLAGARGQTINGFAALRLIANYRVDASGVRLSLRARDLDSGRTNHYAPFEPGIRRQPRIGLLFLP